MGHSFRSEFADALRLLRARCDRLSRERVEESPDEQRVSVGCVATGGTELVIGFRTERVAGEGRDRA